MIFKGTFEASLNLLLEGCRDQVKSLNDCYAVLLTVLINQSHSRYYNNKGLTVLDSYFQQIGQLAWPRFVRLFDKHYVSMKLLTPENMRKIEKSIGQKPAL